MAKTRNGKKPKFTKLRKKGPTRSAPSVLKQGFKYGPKYSEEFTTSAVGRLGKRKGETSKQIAASTGISRAGLFRYKKDPNYGKGKPGPATILSSAEEHGLATGLAFLAARGLGVDRKGTLIAAKELAERNGKSFKTKDGLPGDKWFRLFSRRLTQWGIRITFRKQHKLSKSRVAALTEEKMNEWFDLLEGLAKALDIKMGKNVLNDDEKQMHVIQGSTGKAFGFTSMRNTFAIAHGYAEQDFHMTLLPSIISSGHALPPTVILCDINVEDVCRVLPNCK